MLVIFPDVSSDAAFGERFRILYDDGVLVIFPGVSSDAVFGERFRILVGGTFHNNCDGRIFKKSRMYA